jgi:hypothetical protein
MNPYSSPQRAAANAADGLEYLLKHDRPEYVYRGQSREYPPPLVPSAYRSKQWTGATYDRKSPEYTLCMRQIGRRFVGIHRFRNFEDIFCAYSGDQSPVDPHETQTLSRIAHDPQIVAAFSTLGFEGALRNLLSAKEVGRYQHRFRVWEIVLDRHHRALIRLNGCNEFLGFSLGETLGQQYVTNSEYLDVTRSPGVAVFFATFTGPSYRTQVASDPERKGQVGVIYRFTVPLEGSHREFDYYTAPPYVDALQVLGKLEESATADSKWSPREFVVYFMLADGMRFWDALHPERGTARESRIGRQQAGFLVPDELRQETRDNFGRQNVQFQAIEDIAEREGTERFYFRHAEVDLRDRDLVADSLWPADAGGEQRFLELLRCITLSESVLREAAATHGKQLVRMEHADLWIPPRADLLETGPSGSVRRPTSR